MWHILGVRRTASMASRGLSTLRMCSVLGVIRLDIKRRLPWMLWHGLAFMYSNDDAHPVCFLARVGSCTWGGHIKPVCNDVSAGRPASLSWWNSAPRSSRRIGLLFWDRRARHVTLESSILFGANSVCGLYLAISSKTPPLGPACSALSVCGGSPALIRRQG
jgi:hypothetical protein